MQYRKLVFPIMFLSYLFGLTVGSHAQTKPGLGTYTPNGGAAQSWSIDDSHRLIWQGTPYTPSCFSFTPESTVKGAATVAVENDTAKLKALIDAGVASIWLVPKSSLAAEDPVAWQKIIDQLEASSVTYGISLGSDTLALANGYSVAPGINRMSNVNANGIVTFRAPKATRAVVTFVDPHDSSAGPMTSVKVDRGVGRYPLQDTRTPNGVVLIYPFGPLVDEQGLLPDIWDDFDRWRDETLMVLQKIKFGPGLRYFSDPIGQFTPPLDGAGLIPNSPMYAIGFEAYLREKYQTVENLMSSWSMSERDFNKFGDAAQHIPLWWGTKGLKSIWNVQTNTSRRVEVNTCTIWSDINGYLQVSLRQAQDRMASMLHTQIADVPVLANWKTPANSYVNLLQPTIVDGLIVINTTDDRNETAKSVAYATGQASENVRPYMLFLAQPPMKSPQVALSDQTAAIPLYASAGARGLIWSGLNAPSSTDVQTLKNAMTQNEAILGTTPRLLYYPREAEPFIVRNQLPGSIWWVPTVREGSIVDVGPNYRSYTMKSNQGDAQVMWSTTEPRKTTFKLQEPRQISITDAAGSAQQFNQKGKDFTVLVDTSPSVFRGAGIIVPQESVQDIMMELARLLKVAQDRKLDQQNAKYRLNQAQDNLKNGQILTAYLMASSTVNELMNQLSNYLWFEAENAKDTNFDDGRAGAWASGGSTLRLNNPNDPQARGYYVRYELPIAMDGQYHIWISRRINNSSPLEWTVDDAAPVPVNNVQPVGTYANGFGWYQLGTVRLAPGKHSVEIRVTKRVGASDTNYCAELDSMFITPDPIIPNGQHRPTVE